MAAAQISNRLHSAGDSKLSPPFSTPVGPFDPDTAKAIGSISPLPAAYHDRHNKLVRVSGEVAQFIKADLDVSRLNEMHRHLWLAGRPMCARPLHRQKMIERQIVITEQADLHMVWNESRIFLKPIPDYLFDHGVWKDTICKDKDLYATCCGFLLSYIWLVCRQSDLKIASESGLISSKICWKGWTGFVNEVLSKVDYDHLPSINERYKYGELRLNRLNLIYRMTHILEQEHFMRGYMYGYNRYSVFFERNFGWVLLLFLFLTMILTAMQVGLATAELQQNEIFNQVSYGFTVFTIVLPLFVFVLGLFLFVWFVVFNLLATLKIQRQRRIAHAQNKASKVP
ncbi:hypothetical protein BP6252_07385 [Coleophoma cylindrospora]|uniref:Subtilisin-like serine protease n=1 Tax=Coleophoma cylindrospora TaxID=1849047 RepID=A0A3D8RHS5_9HELO|nr:hypothetical protein BP6252_07385 [Coleophoma cylindrospora]